MSVGSAKSGSSSYYGCCDCENVFPDQVTLDMGTSWAAGTEFPICSTAVCQLVAGEQVLTSTGCSYPGGMDAWAWTKNFQKTLVSQPCYGQTWGFGGNIQCYEPNLLVPIRYYFYFELLYDLNLYTYELDLTSALDCESDTVTLQLSNTPSARHCIGWPSEVVLSW